MSGGRRRRERSLNVFASGLGAGEEREVTGAAAAAAACLRSFIAGLDVFHHLLLLQLFVALG